MPDAVSLYARRDTIRNPHTQALLVADEARNRHSTIWLTTESAEYFLRKEQELAALRRGGVTEEEKAAFAADLDLDRLHTLDPDLMGYIRDFFLDAAA